MTRHARKDYHTTGSIAKLVGVAPRTVSKWFDSGLLEGWLVPGSKDRRISEESFRKFLAAHDMPTIEEFQGMPRRPQDKKSETRSTYRLLYCKAAMWMYYPDQEHPTEYATASEAQRTADKLAVGKQAFSIEAPDGTRKTYVSNTQKT